MRKENNFDFLRFFLSSLVIVSHSYPLTNNPEILSVNTNAQATLGDLAVNAFFVLSGFLILTSLKRSKSPIEYLVKRGLRLFPALFFMLLFSLLVISIVYKGNNILNEPLFFTYLPNNFFLYNVQYYVNGVFDANPYPQAINGSLWTLSYEFSMYLFVLLLYPIRKNAYLVPAGLLASFLVCYYAMNLKPDLFAGFLWSVKLIPHLFYRLAIFFIAGCLLSLVQPGQLQKLNKPYVKVILSILLIVSFPLQLFHSSSPFILSLLIILLAISYSKQLSYLPQKIGDISYGIYIYGFLVQQTLMNYYNFPPLQLTILSLIVTYILSYLSWHLIEKRFLKLKQRLR